MELSTGLFVSQVNFARHLSCLRISLLGGRRLIVRPDCARSQCNVGRVQRGRSERSPATLAFERVQVGGSTQDRTGGRRGAERRDQIAQHDDHIAIRVAQGPRSVRPPLRLASPRIRTHCGDCHGKAKLVADAPELAREAPHLAHKKFSQGWPGPGAHAIEPPQNSILGRRFTSRCCAASEGVGRGPARSGRSSRLVAPSGHAARGHRPASRAATLRRRRRVVGGGQGT